MAVFRMESLVRETSGTTGTGSYFVLTGAVPDHRSFASAYVNGEQFWYMARAGSQWEEGIGQFNATNGVFRTAIKSSDGAGTKCNFTTAPEVYVSPIGSRARVEGPSCLLYMSANQSLSAGVPTKVAFDTALYDSHFAKGFSNDIMIISDAGIYQVDVGIDSTAGFGSNSFLNISVNDASVRKQRFNGPLSMQISAQLKLNAGDIVTVYAQSGSAATIAGGFQEQSWFNVTFLRTTTFGF